jgi:plastocyanin
MNSAVSKWVSGVACVAAVVIAMPTVAAGQGSVAGQITIQEKPGEQTADLGNTVVWLEPAGGVRTHPAPTNTQMSMDGRKFSPHLRVVTPGSKVDFPNQDPFSHNIFSSAEGGAFDLGLYGRGESKSTTFAKAGAYPIYCNIHARMTGFIVVVSTTQYTLAGNDGRYSLDKTSAGRYVMHVWHERAPEVTKELSVGGNGASGVDVALDARGFKFVAHKNKFGQDYKAVGERY